MIVKFRNDRSNPGWTFLSGIKSLKAPAESVTWTRDGFGDHVCCVQANGHITYTAVLGWVDDNGNAPVSNAITAKTFYFETSPEESIALIANQEVYLLNDEGKTIEALHKT